MIVPKKVIKLAHDIAEKIRREPQKKVNETIVKLYEDTEKLITTMTNSELIAYYYDTYNSTIKESILEEMNSRGIDPHYRRSS